MTEALQKRQAEAVVAAEKNPSEMMALALEHNADPVVLSKLMDLQERWEANQARKAFTDAMSNFKRECPAVIGKDRGADFGAGKAKYTYATTGAIVTAITPALSRNGLSLSWETEQGEKTISVTCHVTHAAGHRESAKLTGPKDESGGKNPIQQIGSSVHYLQRYTMVSVLGLATADMDDPDDAPRAPVSEPRAKTPSTTPEPQSDTGPHTIDAMVEVVSKKPTANGGTRYGIKANNEWYNTFEDGLAAMAEALKGQVARLTYTVSGQYKNLTDIRDPAKKETDQP